MTTYQICFFDIDGTLADNELPRELGIFARIPESAKKALAQLQTQGIETVLATGRNLGMIADLAQKLNIGGVISSNGNQVSFHGQTIFQQPLEKNCVEQIIAELDKQQIQFLIETPDKIFCYENFQFYSDPVHPHESLKRTDPLPENILQLIVHVHTGQPPILNIPGVIIEKVAPIAFNIHAEHISKASGILTLLEELQLAPEAAVAFGDEENDFHMFEVVGCPVAMGNANPLLKEKAKMVTDKVGENGIYNACIKLGLIENN